MTQQSWFTSDQHHYHKNICKYSNRPFASVEEMNETLIKNHNELVQPHDMVYSLGDLCFGGREQKLEIIKRLNGQFHLILGNHDGGLKAAIESVYKIGKSKVLSISDYRMITVHNQQIVLCHYSIRNWNSMHRNVWMFYGHSHGSLPELEVERQVPVYTDMTTTPPTVITRTEKVLLKTCDVGVDGDLVGKGKYKPYLFWDLKELMDKRGFVKVDHHGDDSTPIV